MCGGGQQEHKEVGALTMLALPQEHLMALGHGLHQAETQAVRETWACMNLEILHPLSADLSFLTCKMRTISFLLIKGWNQDGQLQLQMWVSEL